MAAQEDALNSWEAQQRSSRHARDPELERLLRLLNEHLERARPFLPRPAQPAKPVVLVVGCARAGSTLLMQWLARTGLVAYPTNLISRFYKDAYVGALVHRILFDLDHRGEVFPDKPVGSVFRSELGRTQGADAPHDFGYFWRNHFAFGVLQSEAVRTPDAEGIAALRGDAAAMELVFGKPVMLKAMELNWHIPLLRSIFPDSVFLFIRRDPMANAASLVKARRDFFGDERSWYSYKPTEYPLIKELPAWEQTIAQVICTNRAVEGHLKDVPANDAIEVRYEEFCADPAVLHKRLSERLGSGLAYEGPASFKISSRPTDPETEERARAIMDRFDPR